MRIVNARELTEAEFQAALKLQQWVDLERDPDLEPMPESELRAWFGDDASDYANHDRVVAFGNSPGGMRDVSGLREAALTGEASKLGGGGSSELQEVALVIGHLERTKDPANAHLAGIELTRIVLPSEVSVRGPQPAAAGMPHDVLYAMQIVISTISVVAELLEMAAESGRTSVMLWDDYSPEPDKLWTNMNMKLAYTEREADLVMADVNGDLMDRWVEAAPDGYELVHWKGSCPGEWLPALTECVNAMNDAPTDDLDIADMVVDGEAVQGEIAAREAMGFEYWAMLALGPDGDGAGLTEVYVNSHRPAVSWQWNTVVPAAHRGRRIGRWVKASMWKRLRDERPDVAMLRTGNAASNSQMLDINHAMGFRPSRLMGVWQGDIEEVRGKFGDGGEDGDDAGDG